jgi:hypothetical protein
MKKCGNCLHWERGNSSIVGRCSAPLPKWLFGGNPVTEEEEQRTVGSNESGCAAHSDH